MNENFKKRAKEINIVFSKIKNTRPLLKAAAGFAATLRKTAGGFLKRDSPHRNPPRLFLHFSDSSC
jgi:hypothetical protein